MSWHYSADDVKHNAFNEACKALAELSCPLKAGYKDKCDQECKYAGSPRHDEKEMRGFCWRGVMIREGKKTTALMEKLARFAQGKGEDD